MTDVGHALLPAPPDHTYTLKLIWKTLATMRPTETEFIPGRARRYTCQYTQGGTHVSTHKTVHMTVHTRHPHVSTHKAVHLTGQGGTPDSNPYPTLKPGTRRYLPLAEPLPVRHYSKDDEHAWAKQAKPRHRCAQGKRGPEVDGDDGAQVGGEVEERAGQGLQFFLGGG